MEIYKTYLFSAEIFICCFFFICFIFNVTVQVITWTYATSLYATPIQFTIVPNYFFFFMRRNVYSSQWEARAEWFQRTQDDDDDCKMGQQGLPKFRFLSHTYCWLHRNAVPKNILFVIWNLVSRKRRTTLAASFTNQEV